MQNSEFGKTARRAKLIPNPKARLREQVREVMRFEHYSPRTEETYWQWIKRFLVFCRDHPHLTPALSQAQTLTRPAATLSHPMGEGQGAEREKRWRHPKDMGEAEVEAFLTHLAAGAESGAEDARSPNAPRGSMASRNREASGLRRL